MRAKDITKLTSFHDELNPELWQNNNLKREVELKLLQIAKAFIEFIDIPNLKLEDVTISGSNCSYNYNDQSDIDLHLIVDSDQPCWEPLNALFMAKKSLFNDQHDIKIRGNAVEVYVQDAKQPHISNGIYSVVRDEWIKQPKKITATPDKTNALHKYEFLKHEIEQAIASDDPTAIVKTQARIKDMRKAGLAKNGEFGAENLAFKMLRNDGSLQKLYDAQTVAQDKRLSLPEAGATADDLKLINSAIDFIQNNTKIKPVDDAEAKAQEIINQIGDSKLKRKAKEIFFSAKDNPYVQGGLITTLGSIIANGVIATGQKYGLTPTQTNVMLQLVINSVLPAIYNRMAGKNWKDTIKATFASAMVGAGSAAGLGMMENFADGKVKGKSRPGRVKKAGASCKGSVTSLRQKAKKYGGERGKMYHWCANMKGSKKKRKIDELTGYHGTADTISQFRPLTHFGSIKAAEDRLAYKKIKGRVYEVDLNINNPAVIKDFPGVHSATQFAFALKKAKIFTQDEMLSVTTIGGLDGQYWLANREQIEKDKREQLIKLLKSKGYDGMAYVNRYEDKGHTSYVILDSNQAKIVKEITPEKNVNESDSLKTEILQKLQQMPLTIFGSVVTKDLSQAKDFDVFLDLDTNPDYKKYLNSLLQLAQKHYGWLDPFVLKDGVLYTRKDDATGWVKAKNSAEILQKIRSTGKEINQI